MVTRPAEPLTYQDYVRFPEGQRWELIEGEAFVVPSPNTQHQDIVGALYLQIGMHLKRHGGGRVFVAPYDVLLSETDVVQPDIVVVSDADAHVITERHVRGTPTWLIEVVSDPVRDKKVKRDLYAHYRVPEYWAVDPVLRSAEVHVLDGDRYRTVDAVERATAASLPGLEIDLREIFSG